MVAQRQHVGPHIHVGMMRFQILLSHFSASQVETKFNTLSFLPFKNRLGTGSQTGTNWLHRHHSERTLYLNSPCLSAARLYVYSCITSPLPWFILRDQLGSVYLQLSAGYPSTQRARVAQDPFFAPRWHSHIRIKNRLLQTLVLSKCFKPVNS